MKYLYGLAVLPLFLLFFLLASDEQNIVNVYTHRHYDTDHRLFEKFTKQTGIKVNVLKAKSDELINRLETEGKGSPAICLLQWMPRVLTWRNKKIF